VEKKNGRIICTVKDNGLGPQADTGTKRTSHGLNLTRERLGLFSKLHGAEAVFEMTGNEQGTGAVVSFQL